MCLEYASWFREGPDGEEESPLTIGSIPENPRLESDGGETNRGVTYFRELFLNHHVRRIKRTRLWQFGAAKKSRATDVARLGEIVQVPAADPAQGGGAGYFISSIWRARLMAVVSRRW
jgi:hypothetical protein